MIIEKGIFKAVIEQDEDTENPRIDCDNVGTLNLCNLKNYSLVDQGAKNDDIEEIIFSDKYYCFPVYAYIHSGMSLSLSSFHDRFDSGHAGYIYVSKEKAIEEFDEITEEKIKTIFQTEIDIMNFYLSGEVYGYTITNTETDEEIDSCWGFYGIDDVTNYINDQFEYYQKTIYKQKLFAF